MEGCLGFRWEGPQLPARPHWRWDVTALLICQMRRLLVFLLNNSRLGTFVSFIFPWPALYFMCRWLIKVDGRKSQGGKEEKRGEWEGGGPREPSASRPGRCLREDHLISWKPPFSLDLGRTVPCCDMCLLPSHAPFSHFLPSSPEC